MSWTASLKSTLSARNRHEITLSENPRFARSAVLVLLFPYESGLQTLLTKRTDSVDTHKSQISFPGGMMEKSDKDAVHTALREAQEEIGLDPADLEILGLLDDLAVPSQYVITPVVVYSRTHPIVTPNPVEVAEVFDVPLAFFMDEKNCWTEERTFRGVAHKLWFYAYGNHTIWGATAAIIRNLVLLMATAP